MKEIVKRGATSNIMRVFLMDSTSTTGAGKTGLTSASSGLIISTIADVEATATTYTAAATNVETVTTLGTFAAPTAGKCRFREVDATNFPGVYEIHIADARYAVANSTQLLVSIQCTGVAPVMSEIQLVAVDLLDSVRFGITALPNAAAGASGGLPTGNASGQVTMAGTATGAITASSFTTGAIDASAIATDAITSAELSATAVTEIAAGVWDEAYASHVTAGSFGKLMDIIRKSIYITEGTVSASGVPANSGSYFRTSLTSSVSGSFEGQTLLFTSGALIGQSMIVDTFTQTNGVITTLDTMVATPAASDTFVLIGSSHAYQPREIADGVLARKLDSTGNETSTTTANERTIRSALRYLRNKIDISASTMTITTEDDTTTAWTAALTTTAGLNPVTTVDPT